MGFADGIGLVDATPLPGAGGGNAGVIGATIALLGIPVGPVAAWVVKKASTRLVREGDAAKVFEMTTEDGVAAEFMAGKKCGCGENKLGVAPAASSVHVVPCAAMKGSEMAARRVTEENFIIGEV